MRPIHLKKEIKINQAGIYQISCYTNDKIYIGSSNNISKRIFNQHLHQLQKKIHSNRHLQYHFNKYGEEDLLFDIIEFVYKWKKETLEQFKIRLLEREDYYIKTLKPDFNINSKASSNLGIKMSEKVKERQRIIQTKINGICINQYNLEGTLINSFLSISDASRQTNISHGTIINGLKGIICHNFIWTSSTSKTIDEKLKDRKEKAIHNNAHPNYVYQYDKLGNLLNTFYNIIEASNQTKIKYNIISRAVSLPKNTFTGQFCWSYNKMIKEEILIILNTYNKQLEKRKLERSIILNDRYLLKDSKLNISKPVYQYNMNGKYITSFPSAAEAGRQLNMSHTTISSCRNGNLKSAGGYIWKSTFQ